MMGYLFGQLRRRGGGSKMIKPPWNIIAVEFAPMGKPRMTQADRYRKRDCVSRYWAYKDELRLAVREVLPDTIEMGFAIPMPPSWSSKKRAAMMGQPHRQKPDFDNLEKGFTDALLKEDCRIWAASSLKVWRDRPAILWRPYDASEQLASINEALDLYLPQK